MNKDKIQKVINTLVMARDCVKYDAELSAIKKSIAIMHEELAKPEQEQEPVAYMFPSDLKKFGTAKMKAPAFSVVILNTDEITVPLYTEPPARMPLAATCCGRVLRLLNTTKLRDSI